MSHIHPGLNKEGPLFSHIFYSQKIGILYLLVVGCRVVVVDVADVVGIVTDVMNVGTVTVDGIYLMRLELFVRVYRFVVDEGSTVMAMFWKQSKKQTVLALRILEVRYFSFCLFENSMVNS